MNVDDATFELLAEPPIPQWVVRVSAAGAGFESRAVPIVGRVGDVDVEAMLPLDDGLGFVGYLRRLPADGAHLFVGFADEPLIDTGITFTAPPIA